MSTEWAVQPHRAGRLSHSCLHATTIHILRNPSLCPSISTLVENNFKRNARRLGVAQEQQRQRTEQSRLRVAQTGARPSASRRRGRQTRCTTLEELLESCNGLSESISGRRILGVHKGSTTSPKGNIALRCHHHGKKA